MARFYAHPYTARFIRTLLIKFLLVFVVGISAYAQSPTISSFSPSSGPVGTEVTITGSNFTGANMVYVGSGSTLDFSIIDDTQIKVYVPVTANTGRIQVHTHNGTGSSSSNYTVTGSPVISAFSPTSGPVGTEITIIGTGFLGATLVSIGGGSVTDFTIESDTEIKATVPVTASSGKVVVYSNEGTASSSSSYTLTNGPEITSFSPTSGPVGTEVTIIGTGFSGATTVYIGSGSTTNFTLVSDTQIKVTVPSSASTGKVQVQTINGKASSSSSYTLTNGPEITSFSPTSGPVGTEVTIIGTGFSGATTVYIGSGSTTNFTLVSDTQIKVTVPSSASTGKVQVLTSQGKTVSTYNFAVEDSPIISSFSPSSGPVGSQVTIKGRNFIGTNAVYIGNGSATSYMVISDTEIVAYVPSTASSGTIRVYTPNGQVTSSGRFTVTGAPVITSFSPTSGPVGTEITIIGENFTGTDLVYVGNGSTTAFTIVSSTQLKVIVPATATTGKLIVRTSQGQVTSSGTFTVTGAPDIYSFSPTSGPVGTMVTITGVNFTGATLVYFGSGSTTSFTVVSDTEIQVAVPALASTGYVQVHTPNGRDYSSSYFTVTGAPVITSFSPTSGPVGTEITIIGANFTGTTRVYVGNGSTTTGFTVVSDTELRVTVPATATTGKLLVQTSSGQAYSTGTFTVTGAPDIYSFSPTSGPVGTMVTITGVNFIGATLVYFGSGSTTSFTVVSDTEIQATVPTLASTGYVQVHTPNGRDYSSSYFTVTGAPVITSFSPTSGPVGTEITIIGANFTGANRIYVGSGSTTAFTIVSDTQLKVNVPATATTGKLIVRSTTGQVTSTGTYTVTAPYLSTNPTELTFSDTPVGSSETREYQVSGLGLKNGEAVTINLSNTSPYTISTSAGSGFAKSITLNTVSNNRLSATSIFVRYTPVAVGEVTDVVLHAQGTTSRSLNIRGSSVAPLPVELTSFTASLKDGVVELLWSTASERNNSHFEVEESIGGVNNFRNITRVDSKVGGNSATTTYYRYSHNYVKDGQTKYYRLKQVDFDGKVAYSRTIGVKPLTINRPMFVAPNPLTINSKVYFTASKNGTATIKVSSIRGNQIYFERVEVHAGENAMPLSKYNNLRAGIYIVTIEQDGKQESVRILKQ